MPSAAATSAEEPLRPRGEGTPSNSPIEASQSAKARPAEARPARAARRSGAIAQESRLTPSTPRRGGMEGRIDIVGTGLEADDGEAPPPERAQEPERDRGLAAAGAGRGDHEAAGQWGTPVRIRRQGELFKALGAIFCNFATRRAGSLSGVTGANTIQAGWVATQTHVCS